MRSAWCHTTECSPHPLPRHCYGAVSAGQCSCPANSAKSIVQSERYIRTLCTGGHPPSSHHLKPQPGPRGAWKCYKKMQTRTPLPAMGPQAQNGPVVVGGWGFPCSPLQGAHSPTARGHMGDMRRDTRGHPGGTRVRVGSPEGPRDPHSVSRAAGPRLTAWYPVDDITTLVSMATASHGCLCSRSYVTAQPDRRRTPRHRTALHGTTRHHTAPRHHTPARQHPAGTQPGPVTPHRHSPMGPTLPGSWWWSTAAPRGTRTAPLPRPASTKTLHPKTSLVAPPTLQPHPSAMTAPEQSPEPRLWGSSSCCPTQPSAPIVGSPQLSPTASWGPHAGCILAARSPSTSTTNTERGPEWPREVGSTGMLSFAVPRAQPRPPSLSLQTGRG